MSKEEETANVRVRSFCGGVEVSLLLVSEGVLALQGQQGELQQPALLLELLHPSAPPLPQHGLFPSWPSSRLSSQMRTCGGERLQMKH